MARLIYSVICSLDGYVEDAGGSFDWAAPSDEVHTFVNELERPVGTYLYGRRMYETMVFWETVDTSPERARPMREFAEIWRAAEKVVYSRTLAAPASARTRVEREFDPGAIAAMKNDADRDITVGGPGLAAEAIAAGLVDEIQLLICPIVVGAGKAALPDGVRLSLCLQDQRQFEDGSVHLRYRLPK